MAIATPLPSFFLHIFKQSYAWNDVNRRNSFKPKPFLQKFHPQTNIFNYFMLLDSDFGKNEICDFNYLSFLLSGLKLNEQ